VPAASTCQLVPQEAHFSLRPFAPIALSGTS
jgi:hypothetical protein